MKIKKKSIIIPAFTLLIGASLVGSVTGTIAWYQYSTRVNAAYVNVSGGTSGNLQMRIGNNGEWVTRLTYSDINAYMTSSGFGTDVAPITSGPMAKDDALPASFYGNPLAGFGPYASWQRASDANFLRLPLQLRYIERDGIEETIYGTENKTDDKEVAKNVYLSDLLIQKDASQDASGDLSDSIRFHIYSFQDDLSEEDLDQEHPADHIRDGSIKNRLISKNGGTTVVEGKLDLDGDGQNDKSTTESKYIFSGEDQRADLIYGREANAQSVSMQKSYSAGSAVVTKKTEQTNDGPKYYDADNVQQYETEDVLPAVAGLDNNGAMEISYENNEQSVSKAIGRTIAKDPTVAAYDDVKDDYLNVVITIWVEGWQKYVYGQRQVLDPQTQQPVLDQETGDPIMEDIISSVWNDNYFQSKFNVGFELAVDPAE